MLNDIIKETIDGVADRFVIQAIVDAAVRVNQDEPGATPRLHARMVSNSLMASMRTTPRRRVGLYRAAISRLEDIAAATTGAPRLSFHWESAQ